MDNFQCPISQNKYTFAPENYKVYENSSGFSQKPKKLLCRCLSSPSFCADLMVLCL